MTVGLQPTVKSFYCKLFVVSVLIGSLCAHVALAQSGNSDRCEVIALDVTGKKLSQWPENSDAKSSVRTGDQVSALYEKLIHISRNKSYSSKFERIFLQTKELSASYDPMMAESPQWYFAYTVGTDLTDNVEVYFRPEIL